MKVAINGLGRIGRHLFRLISKDENITISFINEPFASIEQLKTLLQHDSIYGNYYDDLKIIDNNLVFSDNKKISVYSETNFRKLDLSEVDLLIESSGKIPVKLLKDAIKNQNPKLKIIITCDCEEEIDQKIIFGTNQDDLKESSQIISTMTCDATAITPILKELNTLGIKNISIISLHPVLSNQQLLDNSPRTINNNADLSLWRSSLDNLIPKETSIAKTCMNILPNLKNKIIAYQMRVPTTCISSAFIDIEFHNSHSKNEILKILTELDDKIVKLNKNKYLISKDFCGSKESTIIDFRRFIVQDNKLKLLIWYDNEFGYSSRVFDLIKLVSKRL